jgi:SAM-dependent methyltransferase
MRCIHCGKSDKWENVDRYRHKPEGMSICECGFISYPQKYKTKEEILAYYRKDYRQAPSVNNLFTGNRKNHYHAAFLMPVVQQWQKEKKKDPVIVDVGAAMGVYLNLWKSFRGDKDNKILFPEADLNGVELTTSFRRVAFHEFGFTFREEIDKSKQYDLITSYKVAEHQLDADKELESYHDLLKDDGWLYIGVPTWFDKMHNFGIGGWSIEYYYHPDHINTWSRVLFEKILIKAGFRIVHENHKMYDSVYLCQKIPKDQIDVMHDELDRRCKNIPTKYDIMANLEKIQKADKLLATRKHQEAIEIWPNCPTAWKNLYEFNKKVFHDNGWEWIKSEYMDKFLAADGRMIESLMMCADICMRYNKLNDALDLLTEALRVRPMGENILTVMSHCYNECAKVSKNEQERLNFIGEALKLARANKQQNAESFNNSVNWIYQFQSQIPIPGEENG